MAAFSSKRLKLARGVSFFLRGVSIDISFNSGVNSVCFGDTSETGVDD